MAPNLRRFVNSLAGLGLAFTELQVMKLAASFRMFPSPRLQSTGEGSEPIPSFRPEFGDFGQATYHNGELKGWEPLGTSRYLKDTNRTHRSEFSASPGLSEPSACNGNNWVTHTLCFSSYRSLDGAYTYRTGRKRSEQFSWEDIFNEAQDLSRRLNIEINSISLCCEIHVFAVLKRLEHLNCTDVAQILYYHRSPFSLDPREVKGFLSTSKVPDNGEWEDQMKQEGRYVRFAIYIRTYGIEDDWCQRYERELLKGIATMPGGYPGIHIEEVL
ncbi:hypothetical protein BDV93DRAFT_287035 [Ceratobasidium sp. AG-I]|nr:hypothetical protein BDV93DRAFT_287035 [Ceratobasidium sp. AG-I]